MYLYFYSTPVWKVIKFIMLSETGRWIKMKGMILWRPNIWHNMVTKLILTIVISFTFIEYNPCDYNQSRKKYTTYTDFFFFLYVLSSYIFKIPSVYLLQSIKSEKFLIWIRFKIWWMVSIFCIWLWLYKWWLFV